MEVGIALSGNLDYAGGDPRLTVGLAGTRMSVATMKRLWPVFVASKVRNWVEDHVQSGTIERMIVATCGLVLCGAHLGMTLGAMLFAVWAT